MILRPLQPAEAFYRFNTPRWSYRPTSGAGAAKVGGRFNRPGVEALYLSRSVETASAEYQQDEPLMPPGTLVTYRIALSQVVDFQKGYVRAEWDELWADWHCEWRKLALYEEIDCRCDTVSLRLWCRSPRSGSTHCCPEPRPTVPWVRHSGIALVSGRSWFGSASGRRSHR